MSIYRVQPNIEKYKAFHLVDDDDNFDLQVEGYFDFMGQPKANDWNGARVYLDATFDKAELLVADITNFNVSALAYSEKAISILQDVLEESGELLPFECDGKKWWIHNITNVLDALDKEETTMELMDSGRFMIGKTVLDENKLTDVSVFKTKQRMTLLLSHDVAKNDYKTIIENSDLTGVIFSQK